MIDHYVQCSLFAIIVTFGVINLLPTILRCATDPFVPVCGQATHWRNRCI